MSPLLLGVAERAAGTLSAAPAAQLAPQPPARHPPAASPPARRPAIPAGGAAAFLPWRRGFPALCPKQSLPRGQGEPCRRRSGAGPAGPRGVERGSPGPEGWCPGGGGGRRRLGFNPGFVVPSPSESLSVFLGGMVRTRWAK